MPGANIPAPFPSSRRRLFLLALILIAIAGLSSLGVWQLERRAWKHDLIERVDARTHAAPIDAPGPKDWPRISDADDAYLHVTLHGSYLKEPVTLVETTTKLGQGYWVLSPLQTGGGFTVLINRGFVPRTMRETFKITPPPDGETTIIGLLRTTEPHGRSLRPNQPSQGRWYSRDIAAIASARELSLTAPYFVDDENSDPKAWPRGGMTVVQFVDNHLAYALTWFALALMLAVWAGYSLRKT